MRSSIEEKIVDKELKLKEKGTVGKENWRRWEEIDLRKERSTVAITHRTKLD